jgi:hypothetical protein
MPSGNDREGNVPREASSDASAGLDETNRGPEQEQFKILRRLYHPKAASKTDVQGRPGTDSGWYRRTGTESASLGFAPLPDFDGNIACPTRLYGRAVCELAKVQSVMRLTVCETLADRSIDHDPLCSKLEPAPSRRVFFVWVTPRLRR